MEDLVSEEGFEKKIGLFIVDGRFVRWVVRRKKIGQRTHVAGSLEKGNKGID